MESPGRSRYLSKFKKSLPPAGSDILSRAIDVADSLGQKLFAVGGRLRDIFLERVGIDLDLVVEGDGLALAKALKTPEANLSLHARFNTATLNIGAFTVDIAMARSESYPCPGALPEITPGTIDEDLARRDFTINAMALRLNGPQKGRIIDPTQGLKDLGKGLIRILHPESFKDDATRIMRAIRYEQRFGFRLEEATRHRLIENTGYLDTISADRLRYEMECIFREPYPEKCLRRASDLGVCGRIGCPDTFGNREAGWFESARRIYGPAVPPGLYFGLLAYGLDDARPFIERLNLPRNMTVTVTDTGRLKNRLADFEGPIDPVGLYHRLKNFDPMAVRACRIAATMDSAIRNLGLFLDELVNVKPSLTGKDLLEMGVSEGPEMGRLLEMLIDASLEGKISSRRQEIALVEEWLKRP